jgi:hypothetical protein
MVPTHALKKENTLSISRAGDSLLPMNRPERGRGPHTPALSPSERERENPLAVFLANRVLGFKARISGWGTLSPFEGERDGERGPSVTPSFVGKGPYPTLWFMGRATCALISDAVQFPHSPVVHAISSFTTLPYTSVRRKSRPAWRKVNLVWSKPNSRSSVACRSWMWTGFSTALNPNSSVAPWT